MNAHSVYTERLAARDAVVRALEFRAARISWARVAVAVAAVGLLPCIVLLPLPSEFWWVLSALVVVFGALVVVHGRLFEKKERALAARRFYASGLARLDGHWQKAPSTGLQFRDPNHLYADDLDLFGPASLFQLLDVTQTHLGAEQLAGLLTGSRTGRFPDEAIARQKAAADLAPRIDFRERLFARGAVASADRPDPARFLTWAEGAIPLEGTPEKPGAVPPWLRAASFVLPAVTISLFVAAPYLGFPRAVAVLPFLAQLALLRALGERLARIGAAVTSQERSFVRFADILAEIENEPFSAPLLVQLKSQLSGSQALATREMKALTRIVGYLDAARNNEVFRFIISPVLLWDVHCIVALEAWRLRAGKWARVWLHVAAQMEALASLAAFAFERPAYAFPELSSSPKYQASALGHPLIVDTKRVSNDVELDGAGTALVITGSNMSGKSTLLRAMGVNAVLAFAGAPVCAASLTMGPSRIATSMRIKDSLEHGVSHFYAEVEKLKRVLDLAQEAPVLFLLDEILHGTNSRERLIGARAVVRELLRCGALGGVSTHDLGIGDLEEELPGKVKNIHFQEQVEGDRMTFDYKLRMGVVTSSNALRLMRMVGISVVPLDP